MPNAKAKILYRTSKNVDIVELKSFMEMHGYPFGFNISPFGFRYPPAMTGPMMANPAKLKEKMLAENETFSVKLHDFNKLYLKHASGLLDMSSSMFAPGHPMSHAMASDFATKEENEKLRVENAELKKRLEQLKSKKQA